MKKTLSLLLSGALLSLSFGPSAQAAVGRAALGSSSGSSTANAAASGAASLRLRGGIAPVRTNLQSLHLNASLPSIRTIGLRTSINNAASVSVKPAMIAVPVEQGAFAAAKPVGHAAAAGREAAATRREVKSKSRAVAAALKSVGNIGSAAAEGAYSLGRRIDSILFSREPIRSGLFDGSVNAAFERSLERARAPRVSEDWLEISDSLRVAGQAVSSRMLDPHFVFAEIDIEESDGVLRVSETRLGYFGFKYESWIRVSVKPGESAEELTVRRDQSRRILTTNFPGRLTTWPKSKLTLKKAIERVRGQIDGYTPKRVLFMEPAGYLDTAQGAVFRMIDAEGVILDVDANTGRVYGTPQLRDDGASRHFLEGTVPAPDQFADEVEVVSRNPNSPGLSGPAQLGIGLLTTAVLTGLSAALAAVTGWHFAVASVGIMMVSALAAIFTMASGIQHDSYTDRSRITSHTAVTLSYGMMLGTILFGVGFLAMAYLGVTPAMLVSALGLGALGAGAAGLIYRFYDEAGNIAEVDPVNGEAKLTQEAPVKPKGKGLGGLLGFSAAGFGATFVALLAGTAGLAMLDVAFTASILLPVLAAGALGVYLWTGAKPVAAWSAVAGGGNRRAIAAALVIGAALLYLALGLTSPTYTIQMLGAGSLGLGAVGGMLLGKPHLMPDPAGLYERAYEDARAVMARQKGYRPSAMKFVGATAAWPLSASDLRWTFTFRTPHQKHDGVLYNIDIVYKDGLLTRIPGRMDVERHTSELAGDLSGLAMGVEASPSTIGTVLRTSPEAAMGAVRRRFPEFQAGRASAALQPGAGSAGWVYRFYDEAGNIAEVDPVNGEARVVKSVVAPAPDAAKRAGSRE